MKLLRYYLVFLCFASICLCYGQPDTSLDKLNQLPAKYYTNLNKKLESVDGKLTKKSIKFLATFERQEQRIQEKFSNLHTGTVNILTNATEEYSQLTAQMKSKAGTLPAENVAYNPYIDTLSSSLSFLQKFSNSRGVAQPIQSLNGLQSKLQQSEKVKEFIAQRKQQINGLLSKYTSLPLGLKNQYARLNRTAYYYSAQVNEYKQMLKDPSKAEKKSLSLLTKLPAFKMFMSKNSQLAGLFRLPGSYPATGQAGAFTGLQTRSSVQQLIQQKIIAGGPNAQQAIQQNIAQAQGELDKLKGKLVNSPLGPGGEMPDFKANTQKTKNFLKRIEYGANVQFQKSSNIFPSTTNIGVSMGYKLNDKSIIGLGISYKLGMGSIRHIVISNQGISLRSYVDYKLKGSLFISGGYEMNYNTAFKNIQQLKSFKAWQSSGLIGAGKKYAINKNVKGEMKLLYDFLAGRHTPVTQPIVFRLGYNF